MTLACADYAALAGTMKLQAFLLWGTDDSKPPEGKAYKPVELDVRQKLKDLPLKWTNWFEVNRKEFITPGGGSSKVSVSDKCELVLTRSGDADVEVVLIGKGKEVVRRRQALPTGEMLVLGGNAPNSTAWLVVIKRLK
jgi:hypothetical protein